MTRGDDSCGFCGLSGQWVAGHLTTVLYERPWRRLFRKRMVIRCYHCDLRIVEP